MGKVLVKIATLKGVFLEKEVSMVLMPAKKGEVGVMTGHVSMVFRLMPGFVKLRGLSPMEKDDGVVEKVFIHKGFAKVHNNMVNIVTDDAKVLQVEDLKHAQQQIQLLERQLTSSSDLDFIQDIEEKLELYRRMVSG